MLTSIFSIVEKERRFEKKIDGGYIVICGRRGSSELADGMGSSKRQPRSQTQHKRDADRQQQLQLVVLEQ